jgi:hypothetical protein
MDNNGISVFWAAFGGGAAAGIVMLLVELLRWYMDRPLLKVSMTFMLTLGHHAIKDNTRFIVLVAKNPHSKPVTVETFGFDYKSKPSWKLQVTPDGSYQFPYEVKGGQSLSQRTTEQNLFATLRKEGQEPSDLKGVWFESSSGKVFHGKIPPVSMRVLKEAFQAQTDETKIKSLDSVG